MADCWDDIAVGIKVEVVNTDCDNFSEDFPDYYWVASIVNIAGLCFFAFHIIYFIFICRNKLIEL